MGTFLSESSSRSALGVAAVTALLAGYRAVACDTHSISISTTTRSIRTTKTTHTQTISNISLGKSPKLMKHEFVEGKTWRQREPPTVPLPPNGCTRLLTNTPVTAILYRICQVVH